MESLIKDNMLSHLLNNNLLNANQHGFLLSHSMSGQLLECFYAWWKAYDEGTLNDILYLDFSKAFDVISHSKFIHKLKYFNFCNPAVSWLAAFLLDRTQAAKFNQSISSSARVTSGAPEGSVIGPLIFVLYVNDLSSICTPCSVKLYADNIKLYFIVKMPPDRAVLQSCLDRAHYWALKLDLRFSLKMPVFTTWFYWPKCFLTSRKQCYCIY